MRRGKAGAKLLPSLKVYIWGSFCSVGILAISISVLYLHISLRSPSSDPSLQNLYLTQIE